MRVRVTPHRVDPRIFYIETREWWHPRWTTVDAVYGGHEHAEAVAAEMRTELCTDAEEKE